MPPRRSPSGLARLLLTRALRPGAGALLVLAIAAGGLVACGGSDAVTGTTDVSGAYSLRTLDGKAPPVTVIDTSFTANGQTGRLTVVITGGAVTLTSAGAYSVSLPYTLSFAGQPQATTPLMDAGTWTRSGSTVTFNSSQGQGTTTAALSGTGTLTLSQDLVGNGIQSQLVFQK